MTLEQRYQAAVESLETNGALFNLFMHGGPDQSVVLDSGESLPTLSKVVSVLQSTESDVESFMAETTTLLNNLPEEETSDPQP